MCGICGFNYKDEHTIRQMNDEIRHRGPDGEGYHIDDQVSLGHRRLSIIDIEGGKNPIYNEDGSICIIFNGEIYNYRELRPELEKKGHIFTTNTDTEVILHAYEEFGVECLSLFNGMFAFCIYDKKENLLFLARDRFGIKPLYYFFDDQNFIFASEIKALLKNPKVKTKPHDRVIQNYLKNGVLPEDLEETFFENISKLLPSHFVIVKGHKLEIKRYFEIKVRNEDYTIPANEKKLIKEYRHLFTDAVKLRLRSDVQVGACLSGGMDSSSIVAVVDELLKQHVREGDSVAGDLNCFSSVHEDSACDEREYIIEAIKNKKAVKHYTIPEPIGLWKDLKKVIYHQDEPTESVAVYAQYDVMRLAHTKVKVLLDGQGSDESLGGYIPYFRHYLLNLLKQNRFFQFFKECYYGWPFIKDLILTFIRVTNSQKKSVDFFPPSEIRPTNYLISSNKTFTQRQYYDLTHGLRNVLRYEDRNSMAFGIESRIPFLDYRLVEFCFKLPVSMRIRNGWTKFILRHALHDILADKIKYRKSKLGYPVPEYDWLVTNQKHIVKIFKSKKFKERKYFYPEKITQKFQHFCEDREMNYLSPYFWRILNTELWLEIFFR